jgi:hypothetical protein
MVIPSSNIELALFRAFTSIRVWNGNTTSFWNDWWLQGQTPREIAPALFRLAWRKNISVAHACSEGRWMHGLRWIVNTEEISQFVALWSMISGVQLSESHDDISWRFTADGNYSARSAYGIQFLGSMADHNWNRMWKTGAENKCKIWGWLIL